MFKMLPKIKTFKLPPTTSTTIFGQTVTFSDALKLTFFGFYLNVCKSKEEGWWTQWKLGIFCL